MSPADRDELDPEVLEIAREEADEGVQRIEQTLLALEAGEGGADAIDAIFRDAHSIKGSSTMVGWSEVASIAHALEDRLEEARDQGALAVEMVAPLLGAIDAIRRSLGGEGGLAAPAVAQLERAWPMREGGATEQVQAGPEAVKARAESQSGGGDGPGPSIRVEAEKVDRMMAAVGETVLQHRRLEHLLQRQKPDEPTSEALDEGGRLLEEFQDSVIEMRTLPLSSITAPFPRAVRDLAADQGKEVELVMSGTETQLDRLILERLSETIIHVLRNAVAHGIESPAEREQAGKPRRGTIELRAEQRSGMVAVEIADDGKGVSAGLLTKAREEGSLADVLAAPGFSTAAEVSGVAGRGVGLDAVRGHVEKIGGSLEVLSETGRGTEVVLLLPVSLALLHVLLFERGGHPFGLPMASVREVITAKATTELEGRRSISIRGDPTPFGDLAEMIGTSGEELPEGAPAVVVASAGRRVAVGCDAVLGDQEIVVKTLGSLFGGLHGYLGAAILGDGRIALILDHNDLLKTPKGWARPRAEPDAAEAEPRLVLVVDDQYSVRELQRSILETAGYRVETASNGLEALEHLAAIGEERQPVDLVLTDVQMPEMDGFELVERIRADPERASLPVVVVTSKGGEEYRKRGAEVGADAYIVKDEFDQHALLDTLERLVGR